MPADIWIVNLFILGVVLLVDVGHRRVKWGRVYRPFLVALLIVPFFVKSPQLSGKGLLLEAVLLVAGALFGLVAVFGFMRVARGEDGLPYSEAGLVYAALGVHHRYPPDLQLWRIPLVHQLARPLDGHQPHHDQRADGRIDLSCDCHGLDQIDAVPPVPQEDSEDSRVGVDGGDSARSHE